MKTECGAVWLDRSSDIAHCEWLAIPLDSKADA